MMRKTKVYIAGPYSGNPEVNTRSAQEVWDRLWKAGYAPFCPHWSHYQHVLLPLPYEEWLAFDLEWLPTCDVLLRLPGASHGANGEEGDAFRRGMSIYHDIEELIKVVPKVWYEHMPRKTSVEEQIEYQQRLAGRP